MVTDWTKPFEASYRYMRVSRRTGMEVERLASVLDGGSLERNQDKSIKDGGSLRCVGPINIGPDLLRVYLDARFDDGASASVPLGTYLVRSDSRTANGVTEVADVELLGRLRELEQSDFGQAFSIPEGSDIVAFAKGIVEAAGLVCVADESAYRSTERLYYGLSTEASAEGSKLAVVNDLLARAGFSSAWTDGMGTVHLTRYVEVADRPIAHRFSEGRGARFLREVTDSTDTSGIANVVYAVYESEGNSVIGSAVDDDPSSPWSTSSLGREIVSRAEYSDTATQGQADEKALELLRTSQALKRKVVLRHVYAPVKCGDAVAVEYRSAGIDMKMAIRTMRLELDCGCLTESEVTAYVR